MAWSVHSSKRKCELDLLRKNPCTPAVKLGRLQLIVALGLFAAPVAEAQPPIRIGASVAQTGAYAAPGQNQLRGYQLCVKHMNDKGEVLGRKLELVVYDDGSDPATAVRLYEKLIAQDKVHLVLSRRAGAQPAALSDAAVEPAALNVAVASGGSGDRDHSMT